MRLLCFIWSIVYRRYLWNEFYQEHDRVVRVKGWRTALVETRSGNRKTITPLFRCLGE